MVKRCLSLFIMSLTQVVKEVSHLHLFQYFSISIFLYWSILWSFLSAFILYFGIQCQRSGKEWLQIFAIVHSNLKSHVLSYPVFLSCIYQVSPQSDYPIVHHFVHVYHTCYVIYYPCLPYILCDVSSLFVWCHHGNYDLLHISPGILWGVRGNMYTGAGGINRQGYSVFFKAVPLQYSN